MKYKMLAIVLALSVTSWAQTATQIPPSAPQQSTEPAEKAKCPCCDKMAAADTKDGHACCAHHAQTAADGREASSCCSGKGAKSCCAGKNAKACAKNDKDKAACCAKCGDAKAVAACCDGKCGKDGEKGCCSEKKTEKTTKNCCADDLRSENETVHTFAAVGR